MSGGLNGAEIEALIDEVFPQARKLGWVLDSVGEGRCRVSLPLQDQHMRPGPTVSGPTLMSLADVAMYFAVLGVIGREALAVTTNLNINFMRRASTGTITADAEILKHGRRLIVGEVTMRGGSDDAVVAHATLTYSIPG